MNSQKTLITVAPTGAESSKVNAPRLPTSLEEIVNTAIECEAAGAALIHVHIRDGNHEPSLDLTYLKEAVATLREKTSLVIQLSTGGSVRDRYEDRIRTLEAEPDSCSLSLGTINFGDDIFMNPLPFVTELYRQTKALNIVPEFELFDLGHAATLDRLLIREGLPFGKGIHCNLVLGVPGGVPGNAATLIDFVRALPKSVTSWSATGVGRTSVPVALATLASGGHLRVGMEDTLTFGNGERVRDNAQLVDRAVQLATIAHRPPMTGQEARQLLGVKDRHYATL